MLGLLNISFRLLDSKNLKQITRQKSLLGWVGYEEQDPTERVSDGQKEERGHGGYDELV